MAALFQSRTIQGTGNYDTNAEVMEILGYNGKKLGDWQTEEVAGSFQQAAGMDRGEGVTTAASTRQYIDTPWGRVYKETGDQFASESNTLGAGVKPTSIGWRYANENGSDALKGMISDDGTFYAGMDRESNAEMNTWLAIMATVGYAAYAAPAAGAAAGAAEGAAAAGSGGIFAGMSAAEIALAAGSIYGATQSGKLGGGGSNSTSVEPGDPDIKGPTPPPAPPVIEYQNFIEDFQVANREATRNKTNLNPNDLTNALFASGNLLLGA